MSTPDERRLLKTLYLPPADEFVLVEVPEMRFMVIDGEGDHDAASFAEGTKWLLAVVDAIRPVAKERMGKHFLEPPLEVLWWADDMNDFITKDRDRFRWRQMIVMAEWVDEEMVSRAVTDASERLGEPPSTLRLERFAEGTCVQIMHVGPEGTAVQTMTRLYDGFLPRHNLVATGRFHEIYLTDPKRPASGKLKTVLRQPVEHVAPEP
jgi:hypothetical protein